MLLAYLFEAIPKSPPTRSVPRSRLRKVSQPVGNVPRTKPVARSDPATRCLPPSFRSPPGPLGPSGSMPRPDFKQRSLPLRVARFSFAPRCAGIVFYRPRVGSPFRISPASDRRSGARPLSRSSRSPLLNTAFRSPAAKTRLATNLRSRVNVPGLHLRSDPEISARPVRSRAPAPAQVL